MRYGQDGCKKTYKQQNLKPFGLYISHRKAVCKGRIPDFCWTCKKTENENINITSRDGDKKII